MFINAKTKRRTQILRSVGDVLVRKIGTLSVNGAEADKKLAELISEPEFREIGLTLNEARSLYVKLYRDRLSRQSHKTC